MLIVTSEGMGVGNGVGMRIWVSFFMRDAAIGLAPGGHLLQFYDRDVRGLVQGRGFTTQLHGEIELFPGITE
jgi:hypothetical protein